MQIRTKSTQTTWLLHFHNINHWQWVSSQCDYISFVCTKKKQLQTLILTWSSMLHIWTAALCVATQRKQNGMESIAKPFICATNSLKLLKPKCHLIHNRHICVFNAAIHMRCPVFSIFNKPQIIVVSSLKPINIKFRI